MSISRVDILKRIRYERRIIYDTLPTRGELVTPGVHDPGEGSQAKRISWLKSRLRSSEGREPRNKEGGMGGHQLIFGHFMDKMKLTDPDRLFIHMNQFIDSKKLNRHYNQYMREIGVKFPGPSLESSAHFVTKRANEQMGEHGVLSAMANFLDKHQVVGEAKKFVEDQKPEPDED